MENITTSLEQAHLSLGEMLNYFTHERRNVVIARQIVAAMDTISNALARLKNTPQDRDVEGFNHFIDEKWKKRNRQSSC